jgi:hypothetical protein
MGNAEKMRDLMFREEALNPELENYLCKSRFGSIMIHHPLIIELFYDPSRCGFVNHHYTYKKEMAEKAFSERDWGHYIGLHERGYRFEALLRAVRAGLSGEEYWKQVSWVWTDSENIYQHLKEWKALWSRSDIDRAAIMDEDEVAKLESLPETIQVWRGTQHKKLTNGLSWTLDKDKAIWFARRWLRKKQKPYLVHGEVKKSDVKALFLSRGENEIVSPLVKVKKIDIL